MIFACHVQLQFGKPGQKVKAGPVGAGPVGQVQTPFASVEVREVQPLAQQVLRRGLIRLRRGLRKTNSKEM